MDAPAISSIEKTLIEAQVIEVLRTCRDPEIPVNIYDLGMVYEVKVDDEGAVTIAMTLTSPNCPAAGNLPAEVATRVKAVPGVTAAQVNLVWEPKYNTSMMSEAAKLELGFE